MQHFRSIDEAHGKLRGCALAIGNFDGVHVGHRALLERAKDLARASGGSAALLTFEPHPVSVLAPSHAPPRIATPQRKLRILEETGIDAVVVQPFDRAYAQNPPEVFVRRDLIEGLQVADVVVGRDFAFGKGRAGNVERLRELAGEAVRIHTLPAVTVDGVVVSSSRTRALLLEGRVAEAARLLGRPFLLDGTVVSGKGRGRTIGIPTANLAPDPTVVPGPGVYAVLAAVEGVEGIRVGAASIGTNPTFGDGETTVEIHLLDFSGTIYGRRMAVAFLERLRGEVRFGSVDELVARIRMDIEETRRIAASRPPFVFAPVPAAT